MLVNLDPTAEPREVVSAEPSGVTRSQDEGEAVSGARCREIVDAEYQRLTNAIQALVREGNDGDNDGDMDGLLIARHTLDWVRREVLTPPSPHAGVRPSSPLAYVKNCSARETHTAPQAAARRKEAKSETAYATKAVLRPRNEIELELAKLRGAEETASEGDAPTYGYIADALSWVMGDDCRNPFDLAKELAVEAGSAEDAEALFPDGGEDDESHAYLRPDIQVETLGSLQRRLKEMRRQAAGASDAELAAIGSELNGMAREVSALAETVNERTDARYSWTLSSGLLDQFAKTVLGGKKRSRK